MQRFTLRVNVCEHSMNSESEATVAWKDQDALRAELVPLLQNKRYEDALSLLYRARTVWPNDEELQVSIEQVKGFLVIKYARKLGGLDRVAPPLPPGVMRTPEVMLLSRYVNGYSTFDDLAQVSPLGRLRTLQVLVSLYTASTPPPIDAEPSSGLRLPGELRPTSTTRVSPESDEAPDTARSRSSAPSPSISTQPSNGAHSNTPSHHAPSSDASSGVVTTTSAPAAQSTLPTNNGSLASIFQPPPDDEYKRLYANGTTAFVQRRYAEAVQAFQACVDLRPADQSAAVMLKRSLSELKLLG